MVSLEMTGIMEFERAFRAVPEALRPAIREAALMTAGEPIRAQMATLAPRGPDAPHIADNILIHPIKKVEGVAVGPEEAAVAIGPSKDFFYGWFWEHGWVHHPQARPFVRPAYDEGVETALAVIGRELWAAMEAAV